MLKTSRIKAEKIELRKKAKAARLLMGEADKQRADQSIAAKVKNLWHFNNSQTIFCYVSSAIEVDTIEIIEYALVLGKRVAVPYCIEGTNKMDFYYITDLKNDLAARSFNILEPIPERCTKVDDFSTGLCIVPALLYDNSGYRLGYGKGYYDRFLSSFGGYLVGLCYSSGIVPALPVGRHDKAVDTIVTEKTVIAVN